MRGCGLEQPLTRLKRLRRDRSCREKAARWLRLPF